MLSTFKGKYNSWIKTFIFFFICFSCCYRRCFGRWWLADEQFPVMWFSDLYCWCTWYLRATGSPNNIWLTNPFRTGDNPVKSTTKGYLWQLQQQRRLFPPDISGRISTGEGGAGTSESLPVNDHGLLITGFQERSHPWCPLWVLWRAALLHGRSLLWSDKYWFAAVAFLLELPYKQHLLRGKKFIYFSFRTSPFPLKFIEVFRRTVGNLQEMDSFDINSSLAFFPTPPPSAPVYSSIL